MRKPRMGRPFWVHVSPGKCPCCAWTATEEPCAIGDSGWYVCEDNNQYVASHGSRHRTEDFFKHHGILPKSGEQILVRLVEVPQKRRKS